MKTAISLPDEIFESADVLANRLHVSRSKLYSMALEKFIHDNQKDDITKKINDYIDEFGQPVDAVFVDSGLQELREATKNDSW
jgi:predicted DNA-binding protein